MVTRAYVVQGDHAPNTTSTQVVGKAGEASVCGPAWSHAPIGLEKALLFAELILCLHISSLVVVRIFL